MRLIRTLAMLLLRSPPVAFSWLRFGTPRAPLADRTAALSTPALEHLPIDPADGSDIATMVAGNRQTKGALPVTSTQFEGALFTHRGRGYARYNEDGAGLFKDESGRLYAAVFDQAGGLGGNIRGQASALAAQKALETFRRIAASPPEGIQVELSIGEALVEGLSEAHQALVERKQGEVTTAVLGVAHEETLVLATSGDSAAVHLNAEGLPLDETDKHTLPTRFGIGGLTHALGLTPEGPDPRVVCWHLEPGHWVVLCSDGLLDSGLTPYAWGEILSAAPSAEAGVNAMAGKVLKRMAFLQAKPDNLTIVAFRRHPPHEEDAEEGRPPATAK